MDLIHIFEILRRSAGILQSPVIIPVKDHADLRLVSCSECTGAKTLQFCSKLCHFTENTCIFVSNMRDYRTMEFFASSHTSSQLEELDRVCSMCQCLVALCTHLSRTLQRIVFLPVLLAWCLLHQHKRLIFQSSHQIMRHSDTAPRRIICRIIVPGNNIHLFCPFEIIKSLERSHQVGCDKSIRFHAADGIALHLKARKLAVRIESTVINRDSRKSRLLTSDPVA